MGEININKMERYARQIILDNWNQELIQGKTVLIAGMGSLGSFSSVNLALLGIGKLIIIDFDTIELSNLNRQLLFTESDIGDYKVEAAKRALERLNPNVKIEAINKDLKKVGSSLFEKADVILDSLDTFEIRRWVNSVAVSLNKPLVHGGIYGWYGNVQVIIPSQTACLECQPLIPKKRLQKYCTLPGEARKGKPIETEGKIPIISTTTMVISGIQSQEALKILLEKNDILLQNYIFYDGFNESFTAMKISRNPDCIVCGEKYKLSEVEFAVNEQELIEEIQNRLILTYGFENPKILIKSKMLLANKKVVDSGLKSGDIIYVVDKRISTPLKLKCKVV